MIRPSVRPDIVMERARVLQEVCSIRPQQAADLLQDTGAGGEAGGFLFTDESAVEEMDSKCRTRASARARAT
jgi:hypothetical protein